MQHSLLLLKGDHGGNVGSTVLSWDDLGDWSGQLWDMASLEERESSFCLQIFDKWEGYKLALTTLYLIGNELCGTLRWKGFWNQWSKRPYWLVMSAWEQIKKCFLGLKSAIWVQILALSMSLWTSKIHPNFLGSVISLWELDEIICEDLADIGKCLIHFSPPSSFPFHPARHRIEFLQIQHESEGFKQPIEVLRLEKDHNPLLHIIPGLCRTVEGYEF